MKNLLLVIWGLFFILPVNAQKFEGKVAMKVQTEDSKMNMDYFIKGDLVRIEMQEEGEDEKTAMLFNANERKMIILVPDEKMYMEMNMDKYMGQDIKEDNNEEENLTKTDETKTINGYKCEKWIHRDEENDNTSEIWMTKDLSKFVFFSNPMSSSTQKSGWQSRIEREGYFPMLTITKDESGKEESRMEVISVEKSVMDANIFSPPSDYQKMSIPGF